MSRHPRDRESASTDRARRRRSILRSLYGEWRDIGGLGRVAIFGIAAAVVLTIAMGFAITGAARAHLLAARAEFIGADVASLPELAVEDRPGSRAFAEFGTAVQHELLGGETERVKVWAPDGTILFSDDSNLVGDRFALSPPAAKAFTGEQATRISDLTDPAHAADRALGQLIEVYVPYRASDGSVISVVEVEQRIDSLNEAMGRIRRNVWLSIGFGVGVLAVFLSALGILVAQGINRRRRQTERLLGSVFRAQEEERRRIVGALHDDVGQPLYRLLYGLEGSRAKLGGDDPVAEELERLESVVRGIDRTLRGELTQLHQGLAEDAGLATALADLASITEAETDLDVHTDVDATLDAMSPVRRTALFRAAQEAVVNARKHAGARSVWISLVRHGDRVVLRVDDDGVGVSAEPSLGLATTRERLEALGGALNVRRRRPAGTTFQAWLPFEEPAT